MPFEGLLGKIGPTLVREATPHLVQLFANLGERFRKDTREIKDSFHEEIASLAHTHAALLSGAGEQREQVVALQAQLAAIERRVDLLQDSFRTLTRQITETAEHAEASAKSTRNLVLCTLLVSVLALGTAGGLLALHLLHR